MNGDIISLGSILSHELNWDADRVYSFLTDWEKNKENGTPLEKETHSTLEEYLDFFHSLPDTLVKGGVISLVEAILKRFVPESFSDEILTFKRETILHFARDAEGDVEAFLRRAVLSPFNDGGHLRSEGVHLLTFHAAKGLEFPRDFNRRRRGRRNSHREKRHLHRRGETSVLCRPHPGERKTAHHLFKKTSSLRTKAPRGALPVF